MKTLTKLRAGRTPIGIDIGSHSIKAAQLRPHGEGWVIDRLASFPRRLAGGPIDVDEAVRLRTVLNRLGFHGDKIIISVPPELALTGMLELPPRMAGVPMDQIARGEFARAQNRQVNEIEIAYWDLPDPARAAKATHLMAVGCPTAEADTLLSTMAMGDLSVVALDHFTSALARACSSIAAVDPTTTAILDLGWSAATLALVTSGVLIYERRMPEGGGKLLHEAVKKQFSMDSEEAAHLLNQATLSSCPVSNGVTPLVPAVLSDLIASHAQRLIQELRLAFSYVARQYIDAVVSTVLLSGGGAGMGGLAENVAMALEVNCRQVLPMHLTRDADAVASSAQGPGWRGSEVVPAMGLAMFPWRGGDR